MPETDGQLHGVAADPSRGLIVAGLVEYPDYDADIHVGLHGDAGNQLGSSVPDLVIADLELPGMSGWEVCKRIKLDAAQGVMFMRTGFIMLCDTEAEMAVMALR